MKNPIPMLSKNPVRELLMGVLLLSGISPSTFAQYTVWNNPGITNSFTYAAGWNEGVVTNTVPNGIEAYLFNGGITVSAGESFTPSQLIMGWDAGQASTYTQSGGNTYTSGFTRVGQAGTNVFTMSGGTYSCSDLMVGWPGPFSNGEGATGTLNQTGGDFETRVVAYIGLLDRGTGGLGGTGSLNVSGGTNTTGRMIVGWNPESNGTINLSGGNKVVRETSFVGFDGGTGTLNVSGGTYTATGTAGLFGADQNFGSFRIADFGDNSGTVNLSGTGVVNAANYTAVGGWGNGTLNITGGTWNQLSEEILVGDAADPNWTGRGEVNQSGGTVNAVDIELENGTYNLNGTGVVNASSYTFVGDRGNGTLNISGGVFNAGTNELGSFRIADSGEATAVGTMSLSGSGVVNAPSYTSVGGLGTGTLNISGGTWNSPDDIVLGDRPPEVTDWTGTGVVNQTGGAVNARAVFLQAGTYNLNGGVLAVAAVGDTKLEANGVFNFDGGTLQATGNHDDFLMADTVEIKTGGATIDTQANNVTIAKNLSGAGGLTKKGAGVLTLVGANAYGGSTTVEAGTLRVQAVNFTADATATTLTIVFTQAPAGGQLAVFPGSLNGNPTVSFTGLAIGQTGEFDPLSGKATFTGTSTGTEVSFSSWSGGQTLTPELLGKYAIGGASGPSASSVRPVLTSTGGGVTLSALVRTNSDAGSFAVIGEYSTNLASWSPLTNNPAGTPSANTNGVPEGFQRKDFTVPSGASKVFLRLKSSL